MLSEGPGNRYKYGVFQNKIENTLKDLEEERDAFIDFLHSMRKRIDDVTNAEGGHTKDGGR